MLNILPSLASNKIMLAFKIRSAPMIASSKVLVASAAQQGDTVQPRLNWRQLSGPFVVAALALCSCGRITEPPSNGSPARLRLLTQDQYTNTVQSLFGPDIKITAQFPPVRRTEGLLAVGAASVGVTPASVEQFQQIASAVASQVVDEVHRNSLIPCKPKSPAAADAACATEFLGSVGRLLHRRMLSDAEVAQLADQAGKISDQSKDFYYGLSLTLAAMLFDPEVLFVYDRSEPDPERPGHRRLTSYSLATRLSLLLWNSAPDNALLAAAERGDLYNKDDRAHIVDSMMASPRFEAGVRAFFDDMLGFDEFDTLVKDPTIYAAFTKNAALDAREQTLRTIVDQLVTKRKDYRDLFTSRDTFLTPTLAIVYGVRSPGAGWSEYEFPENSPRAGLLTQLAFLTVHSQPGRSSSTRRGRALREEFLCQKIPDPPPGVDFSAVEDPKSPLKTARERLTFHRKMAACAGCHALMDPVGLTLENFDGGGQYRNTERGAPIDSSGTLDNRAFVAGTGLGQAIHDDPALTSCLVKRTYDYATGGPDTRDSKPVLAFLEKRFAAQSYTFPALLKAIANSTAFSDVSEKSLAKPSAPNSTDATPSKEASTSQTNAEMKEKPHVQS
jgi:hypothetical protein